MPPKLKKGKELAKATCCLTNPNNPEHDDPRDRLARQAQAYAKKRTSKPCATAQDNIQDEEGDGAANEQEKENMGDEVCDNNSNAADHDWDAHLAEREGTLHWCADGV